MNNICEISGKECYGSSDLNLLYEVSRKLNETKHIKDSLYGILKIVANHFEMNRVILTVLSRTTNKVFTEASYGLSESEKARGKYKIGEGIIGKVAETGRSVIIPKISNEPMFLNKMKKKRVTDDNQEISFICVPIKKEEIVIGTLSVNTVFYEGLKLEKEKRLLSIIGTMIAEAVRIRQDKVEEVEKLKDENQKLMEQLETKKKNFHIIGNSSKIRHIFDLISKVAKTNSTVLIRGESGVGKELIADAIHQNSTRTGKPFIKVNCAALPDTLIESELFGHEKGAFTSAENMRKGRFEMAEGGTIFLDEIGDLPSQTQIKLLRILQEREFERLGGNKTIKVDVRIITATNRNLEKLIKSNDFREDLYYRLNVFPVYVPALRERKNDIPILADHFITKFNKTNHTNIKRITTSAIDLLMLYHWPGNVRELENCIEHAAILSTDEAIRSNNLPPTLHTADSSDTHKKGSGLDDVLDRVEKQLIIDTLISTRGNIFKAAEKLKITERIMGLRVKKYNIDAKSYKFLSKNDPPDE